MEELQEKFKAGQILLIDKPYTWSSFDVVRKIRNTIRIKKVGHAGTLDPLATGLLIVCTGKFTKRIEEIQGQVKEYTGIIELGKTTPSYDLETDFDSTTSIEHVSKENVLASRDAFIGEIEQFPPVFSAIKKDGVRAYEHARKGREVKLESRSVVIHGFELVKIDLPEVHFKITCSKGTYIRSIAHDFGQQLGVGGYLKSLRRTRIGDYLVSDAKDVLAFCDEIKPNPVHGDNTGS